MRNYRKLGFLVLLVISLYTFGFGKSALLLYKGSEQGYGYNILMRYIAPELIKLGVTYKILDVEDSNFLYDEIKKFDLLVTCYYTGSMRNAKEYLKTLFDFLVYGGKVLIINNIGAVTDVSGMNHPTLRELNSVYNLLGISYTYGWKRVKPEKVLINDAFSSSFRSEFKRERDVEPFRRIGAFAEPLIQVSVQDETYEMAFISPQGGMISYSYLFDDNGNLTVDLLKILSRLVYGMENDFKVLVVGPDNFHVRKALDYACVNYFWLSSMPEYISQFNVVIHFSDSLVLGNEQLSRYLSVGGTYVFVGRGTVRKFIKELKISPRVFPVPEGLTIPLDASVGFQEPLPGSEVLLSGENGEPLAWSLRLGSGTIVYYPLDLVSKTRRGLFIQTIFSSLPLYVQPIINSISIQLDDFPLPAYNRKIDMITREFGDITDNDFFYKIWWPMVKKLGRELGLKFTAVFVASYSGDTRWPYNFQEFVNTPEQKQVLLELLSEGYEIAIHGYNHIELMRNKWDEVELDNVLSMFKVFLKQIVGERYIVYSYVAPNNKIDEFGVMKLLEHFPTIRYIGTTYFDDTTISEFTVFNSSAVVVPRTVSGYYPLNRLVSLAVLSIMSLGGFQYYLHPDDLFSEDRNPEKKTWMEMYSTLRNFLTIIRQYYPFLESHFASESGELIYRFFTERPFIRVNGQRLIATLPIGWHLPRYYFLRTAGPFKLKGGKIIYSYGSLWIVEQFENVMEVELVR